MSGKRRFYVVRDMRTKAVQSVTPNDTTPSPCNTITIGGRASVFVTAVDELDAYRKAQEFWQDKD